MRVAVEYRSVSREVYNRFCLKYPDIKLSFEKWREIIYTFNYNFRDYVLETGEKVKFPWGFSSVAISKKKPKKTKEHNGITYINLPVDWKKSSLLGQRTYHLNSHTDGYRYKWHWFASEARFYSSDIWVFKPSRKSSRRLAELLMKPNSNYREIYKQWNRT